MRESMKAMMADAKPGAVKPHLVARNTVKYEANGVRYVRFYHTDIIAYRPNGDAVLNSGGWKTVTTKDRLNMFGFRVYQCGGQWYIGDGVPFYDGMVLRRGAVPKKTQKLSAVDKANKKLAKRILKFCELVDSAKTIPLPNIGDCFICQFSSAAHSNPSHLESHMSEDYLHGSLIVNALRWAGFDDRQISYVLAADLRWRVKGVLRRYLRHSLGLPC